LKKFSIAQRGLLTIASCLPAEKIMATQRCANRNKIGLP